MGCSTSRVIRDAAKGLAASVCIFSARSCTVLTIPLQSFFDSQIEIRMDVHYYYYRYLLKGYFGKEIGTPVVCPAGSIAVFSSLVFHRSGANTSGGERRAYLAQYVHMVIALQQQLHQLMCD